MKLTVMLLCCFAVCLAGCGRSVGPNVKSDTKARTSSDKPAVAANGNKVDAGYADGLQNVDVSTLQEGFGVGDLAPDIVGEDSQGVSFALSDYRGKVVMLDFWGDW